LEALFYRDLKFKMYNEDLRKILFMSPTTIPWPSFTFTLFEVAGRHLPFVADGSRGLVLEPRRVKGPWA
jgi:hypothetical protein